MAGLFVLALLNLKISFIRAKKSLTGSGIATWAASGLVLFL
jgi:hypothetical protein